MPDVHGKSARRVAAGAGDALRRVGARVPEWAWLTALTLTATGLVASQTLQPDAWFTMTDELQYVRLAISVSQELSPLPMIHGQASGAYSQLYPLLLSPVYGIFGTPAAFKLAHVLNALLMASTVVPAYLLTRSVVSRRAAAYAVAALSVAIPWTALTLLLFTESAAYPMFVWAVLAMQRGLTEPSWRRDAVVLVALGIAFLARTQLAVLAFAYPAAALLHECGYSLTQSDLRSLPAALRDGIVRTVARHWLIVGVVVLGALAALVGPLVELLGPYRSTVGQSSLFPPGWRLVALVHLGLVGVGIGVVPVVLGLAWLPGALVRPRTKAAHAFGVLSVLVGLVLFVQASSFVTLYAQRAPTDRYFFYVVPLFLVAGAALVADGPRHWLLVALAALVFSHVALKPTYALYYAYSSSPSAAFHPVLNGRIAQITNLLGLDLTTREGVRWIVILLGAGLAAGVRFVPLRWLAPALVAVLLAFGVGETRYVFGKILAVQSSEPPRKDWVDRAGGGRPVAIAPSPVITGTAKDSALTGTDDSDLTNFLTWWNLEFWNSSARSVYRYNGASQYTPFPARTLAVDRRTGRLVGDGLPRLMVTAIRRTDLEPAGREMDRNGYLKLVELGRTPRARWSVDGLTTPGSGVPRSRSVVLRLYPERPREGVLVALGLKAPAEAAGSSRYRVFSADGVRAGRLAPRGSVIRRVRLCAPAAVPEGIRIASVSPRPPRRTNPRGIVLASVRVTPDSSACAQHR